MRRWCNVLSSVISQGRSVVEEGQADMLTGSLLETITSAGSIVHPTPRLAEYAASREDGGGGGGGRLEVCIDSCNGGKFEQRHAVKVNDRMLRQTLPLACSQLQFLKKAGGWMQLQPTWRWSWWTSSAAKHFMVWLSASQLMQKLPTDASFCECLQVPFLGFLQPFDSVGEHK